jgi:hypothetical protein
MGNLNSHQAKRKGWNPCGLAAILWRSDRFTILVFFTTILVGAAGVGRGALAALQLRALLIAVECPEAKQERPQPARGYRCSHEADPPYLKGFE